MPKKLPPGAQMLWNAFENWCVPSTQWRNTSAKFHHNPSSGLLDRYADTKKHLQNCHQGAQTLSDPFENWCVLSFYWMRHNPKFRQNP